MGFLNPWRMVGLYPEHIINTCQVAAQAAQSDGGNTERLAGIKRGKDVLGFSRSGNSDENIATSRLCF
jgi:hypothetical protein